jgi:cold shock CspA family protein/uncharacterized LabA/DUF88 family protein
MSKDIVKVGLFYDGNYFLHVSNYYNYDHQKRKRISLAGLHDFIRRTIADYEEVEPSHCRIVDSHYFRGRLTAYEASQRDQTLYWDRVFDDVLMSEGITTHYTPMKPQGPLRAERGIELWLSLETYELSVLKGFDVVCLIGGDSDYVPLVRKLTRLGIRVMVLSWDFEYMSEAGRRLVTRTSQALMDEVTYPLLMQQLIDKGIKHDDPTINAIFVSSESKRARGYDESQWEDTEMDLSPETAKLSQVMSIKNGYGFIKFPPNNLFFHYTSLINADFHEIHEGDEVEFYIGRNEEGQPIAINVLPTFARGRIDFIPLHLRQVEETEEGVTSTDPELVERKPEMPSTSSSALDLEDTF